MKGVTTSIRDSEQILHFQEAYARRGAMVLGKLQVPGRPTVWITVGHGPTSLTVSLSFLSSFSSLGDGPI